MLSRSVVLWGWNMAMTWWSDSSVPCSVNGDCLLAFNGWMGWSRRSETASLTHLAPCSGGWKAGFSWDWGPENLHVASRAWWPQDSQLAYAAAQGPRVTDLANKGYSAWALVMQPEVTWCYFCYSTARSPKSWIFGSVWFKGRNGKPPVDEKFVK